MSMLFIGSLRMAVVSSMPCLFMAITFVVIRLRFQELKERIALCMSIIPMVIAVFVIVSMIIVAVISVISVAVAVSISMTMISVPMVTMSMVFSVDVHSFIFLEDRLQLVDVLLPLVIVTDEHWLEHKFVEVIESSRFAQVEFPHVLQHFRFEFFSDISLENCILILLVVFGNAELGDEVV